MSSGIYTTTGKVYDFIVEKCPKNGMLMSFPETIAAMSAQGLLQETMPDSPPFHAGMTTEEFIGLLRQFRVDAAGIANQGAPLSPRSCDSGARHVSNGSGCLLHCEHAVYGGISPLSRFF